MNYIKNLNNQIIAADRDFLKLLALDTIEELSTQIARDSIKITESGDNLEIDNGVKKIHLKQKSSAIATLFGDLILVEALESRTEKNPYQKSSVVGEKRASPSILDGIDILEDSKKSQPSNLSFILDDSIEEEQRAEEQERNVVQQRAKEEADRKIEEAKKVAEAQQRAQAEAVRLAKEEAQKAQEEARKVAEAEQRAQAEAERLAQEEAQKAQEEAKRAKEEADRLAQEEAQRAQEEARKVAEAQQRAQAEAERLAQEEAQKAQEEAKKAAEAEQRSQEEARKVAEAEALRIAEEEEDFSSFLLDESEPKESHEERKEAVAVPTVDDDDSFLLDEDFLKPKDETKESATPHVEEPKEVDDSFLLDEDFLKPKNETEDISLDRIPAPLVEPDLDLDLDLDFVQSDEQVEAKIEEKEEKVLPSADDITIDLKSLSGELGISEDDYLEFLNEFADKAVESKDEIEAYGSQKQEKAISSLVHLSQMLHLTDVSDLLEQIRDSSGEDEKTLTGTFYQVVTKFASQKEEPQESKALQVDEVTVEEEVAIEELPEKDEKICDLDFSDVKPIHFDFQMEKAAEDLSLPVDLIEEFVGDFIEQANEEKQTFFDACRSGDVDTIQKTGHKLKGVASNLRIVPLADTLEEVQFCSEKARFEPLLKKYWGQFLAFEAFVRTMQQNKGD